MQATEEEVKRFFSKQGNVKEVTFSTPKGCGFVQFSTREEADKAVESLNLKEFMGMYHI